MYYYRNKTWVFPFCAKMPLHFPPNGKVYNLSNENCAGKTVTLTPTLHDVINVM